MPRPRVFPLLAVIAACWLCRCGAGASARDGGVADSETGNDSVSASEPDTGTGCDGVAFPVSGDVPEIMVLLDRSKSMAWGEPSVWEQVVLSLNAIVAETGSKIRYGLMLFPAGSQPCEAASPEAVVGLDLENGFLIEQALAATGPTGPGTPTTASMEAARIDLTAHAAGGPQYVLLATDGAPNCSFDPALDCATCMPSGDECSSPIFCLDITAISKAMELHDYYGISTFVLGVGHGVSAYEDVLHEMASRGGTGDSFPAATPAELVAALTEIAAQTIGCTFDVDWSAVDEDASTRPGLVNVLADGAVVPFSPDCLDGQGWHWLDPDTIELCPDLCHDYRYGAVDHVTATFGCETMVE